MEDPLLRNEVIHLFQKAWRHKRPLVNRWNKNRRILRNRTWGESRAPWMPSPEVPEIYPIIATSVGWMTDQRPIFYCNPFVPAGTQHHDYYAKMSQDMNTILKTLFMNYQWDSEIEKVLWDGYEKGFGLLKTTWDGSLFGGKGDVSLKRIDPFYFYPDPQATSFDDAEYFIEARNVTLKELERRFPDALSKLSSFDILTVDVPENLDTEGGGKPNAIPGTLNNPSGAFGQPPTSTGSRRWGAPGQTSMREDDGVLTLIECWRREIVKSASGKVRVSWRLIVVAGDQVLLNEPVENIWSHGRHPYSPYRLIDTGDFWGISMVEFLAPSQKAINRILAALQQNIELSGNPVLLEDARSNLPRSQITNRPGTRLNVGNGGVVQWLTPPPIHPQMSQLISFYISEMERISGLSAMQRGFTPTGRNAQGVLDAVQESGFTRVRMALRNLERAMRDAGALAASLIAEFYTEPRIVQLVGSQDQATNAQVEIRSKHFYTAPTEGEDRVPVRFQVQVDVNSQLPTSRQARMAEADVLFSLGAIDVKALLDAHEWPNRDLVLQRVMEAQAAGLFQPPTRRQGTRPPTPR